MLKIASVEEALVWADALVERDRQAEAAVRLRDFFESEEAFMAPRAWIEQLELQIRSLLGGEDSYQSTFELLAGLWLDLGGAVFLADDQSLGGIWESGYIRSGELLSKLTVLPRIREAPGGPLRPLYGGEIPIASLLSEQTLQAISESDSGSPEPRELVSQALRELGFWVVEGNRFVGYW